MPLISVVIPACNAEQTIQQSIESVLRQTFADFELLVINDGSQDSTLDVVNHITDSRIKIFSYPNAGANVSRNRGLYQASGEYVSFLDADDLWTPKKLETQLLALQKNPDAAVAYSWTNSIDEKGQFLRRGSYITVNGDVYAKLLLVDFVESGSNPLIRREALCTIGGFDESLPAAQDWDMWLRLAARYQFVAVPLPQILYRVCLNSMSANVLRQEVASLQVIERSFTQAPESLQHLKSYSLANRYKCLTFMALQRTPERQQGLAAAKFLGLAIKNDPSLLRARVLLKVLLKIIIIVLLPPQQAQMLLTQSQRLTNIDALLGYLQVQPF
ncbi:MULTISPECIES: glycosyltransferase [unclassified Coleofasciculus]|uniref:glycosyltransferase n=1 Tax=unclassified Coleofasciculus TaxID=2692782 RepID=UPI00187F20FE|nr:MULTISPECIES: glycosyltransferase [unclassified Coleofasciculus]MBE9126707.1 glycosyltransferase [Coleofasciculus sp. LEGE 07081]MBE9150067.1 glycosyltransferase [Coleofasciculus sp. LEGE 07092]